MKVLVMLTFFGLAAATGRSADKGPTLAQARADYAVADGKLNKAYAAAVVGLEKNEAAKLREDERDWIAYRDGMIEGDFHADEGSEKTEPDYWEELAEYAKNRTDYLRGYAGKRVPPGIAGEYTDSYGGSIEFTETKEGVDFDLSAVRGMGHNNGEIPGTLTAKGDSAFIKEKLDAGDEGPACELYFKFGAGRSVEVDEKVPDSGAGAGVHYGGIYYKFSEVRKSPK
jgi:uncharacterized protein YecT (DUF1311 family)